MVEAEPAVVPRPVKSRRARAGRAEFTVFAATGTVTWPPCPIYPAMESILFHRFHMALGLLEVKP